MKRLIGVLVLAIIFWSVFALLVNAQESRIPQLTLPKSTASHKNADGSVAEKKFSASIGLGSAFGLREKELGKLKAYDKSLVSLARLEYSPSKYAGIVGEYSKVSGFAAEYKGGGSDYSWDDKIKIGFTALTLNLKLGIPISVEGESFYPYLIGGIGKAKIPYSDDYKEVDSGQFIYENSIKFATPNNTCSKIGMGVDVKLHKSVHIFTEYDYWRVRWAMKPPYPSYRLYYSQMITGLTLNF